MGEDKLLLTVGFWKDAAERAVKTAAQAVLVLWGGELVSAWDISWSTTVGVAVGGAVVSLLTSIASVPFGDGQSASVFRPPRQ